MRIWLITIGEPLPIDGTNERLLRTGILAEFIADSGHEVVWWTSVFDHARKRHRAEHDTSIQISYNYRLVMLRSSGYKRNISLARLIDHREHARKFAVLAPSEPAPDVILCSMPTIELSRAAVQYAVTRNIPIALDIRDLWPDIFVDHAPSWARGLARLILQPLFRDLRWASSNATAITGITAPIVDWGLGYAGRLRTDLDRDFPFGYVERKPTGDEIERARNYWKERGIGVDPHEFVVCFFGTIGRQFDLDTVIDAARRLDGGTRPFRFVLCGTGDRLSNYQGMADGLSNVVFPGWVGSSEIWALMRMAKLGLAPYHNTKDFRSSLPNKTIEYFSAGLPLATCLTGELQDLVENNDCGVVYAEGNAKSLVETLCNLYDNRQYLACLAHKAFKLYRERFTADRVYGDMMEYLETVAESGKTYKEKQVSTDFLSVTELAGDYVTREQVERLCHRYFWAGTYCRDKDVLEAACGTGQGSGYLSSLARSYRAGDFSEEILKIARSHYGDRVAFQQFDAQEMPFADDSLDIVLLFEALYYIPSAERFVAECKRELRPGGKVLIATANKDLYDFNPSPHSHVYYGVKEMGALFGRYGFSTEFFGNTPVGSLSWKQKILRPVKKFVINSGLMPKTMAGKKLLKRLVFGSLVPMPAEIVKDMVAYKEPVKLSPNMPDREHKVLYCIASLGA